MMMDSVTAFIVLTLCTVQGVFAQTWSVTYQPRSSICASVGSAVDMSCSYTYPSNMRLKQVSWIKRIHGDHLDLILPSNRIFSQCSINQCNLRIDSLTASDSGEYYCMKTDTSGYQWIGTTGVYLEIRELPSVYIIPTGNIEEGTAVTLTCTRSSYLAVMSYSWYKNGSPTALQEGPLSTYTIYDITPEHSGEYYCETRFPCGSQTSALVNLQVFYKPKNTSVVTEPTGVIDKGGKVTLTCSSDANPPVESYTWFKVDESTPVGSGETYNISNIISEDGGQYYCEARNKYGAENSSNVTIYVAGGQSPVLGAVLAVLACAVVCVLCVLLWVRKLKKGQKPAEQAHQNTTVYFQSRGGGGDDDAQYSTIHPQSSREAAGAQQDDVQYSTVLPKRLRQTAAGGHNDVQYASVHFKKAAAAQSSPVLPEGEPSTIYSSVQPKQDFSVVYSSVQPRAV